MKISPVTNPDIINFKKFFVVFLFIFSFIFSAFGQNVYAVRGGQHADFWMYNPDTDKWSIKADIPNHIGKGASMTYDGTTLFVSDGIANSFYRYSLATDSWSELSGLPGGYRHMGDGASVLSDATYIYATAGGNTNEFYRYYLSTNSWTKRANLPGNVEVGGALVYDATYVYALQGGGNAGFYRYSNTSNSWGARAFVPTAVNAGGALTTDGKYIYAIVGGGSKKFYRYDLEANSWTALTNIPASVGDGGALTCDGRYIYAFQGNEGNSDFYRYDIINDQWARKAHEPQNVDYGGSLASELYVWLLADLVTVKELYETDPVVTEGQTVFFRITVTNNGPGPASDVSLTDEVPAGLTLVGVKESPTQGTFNTSTGVWDIGDLESEEEAVLIIECKVDVGTGGQTLTNVTTTAKSDSEEDPSTDGDILEVSVTVENIADLVTEKSLSPIIEQANEGEQIIYLVKVKNNGAAQATNVWLKDVIPDGLTISSAPLPTQGSYSTSTGIWQIGTLDVGDIVTMHLFCTVDAGMAGSTITNVTTAAVSDQEDNSTAGDNLEASFNVQNDADLVIVKTSNIGKTNPSVGDVVDYYITVTNNGPARATNVSLTDLLPDGLTATASNGITTQGTYSDVTGEWSIGTLENGASATLTLQGTIDEDQAGNTIVNTASRATGDQDDPTNAGNDRDWTIVVNNNADLATVKALFNTDSVVTEGEVVFFVIKVTNNGPSQANNVTLTDLVPAGLTLAGVMGDATQGSYIPSTGIWDIGTLENGAQAILLLECTVDAGTGGQTLTNVTTAAISANRDDFTTEGDTLEATIIVENITDLVTVKVLAPPIDHAKEGDFIAYSIEVRNVGQARATNVWLKDIVVEGLTLTSPPSVTHGTYTESTGVWEIGTIESGKAASAYISCTVDVGTSGDTITNITTAADGDQEDTTGAGDILEATFIVDNEADLITEKILSSGNPSPNEGDVVSFMITVTNNGVARAADVTLNDLLPVGLTPTTNNGTVSQGTYDKASGDWALGTLDNGANATLILEGTVDPGQAGNTITNTTTKATGQQNDPSDLGNDLEETIVVNNEADLVTVKELYNTEPIVNEQDNVSFKITVTNNGPSQATNVTLTDQVPAGLTVLNSNPTSGTAYNASTGIWDIGTLGNGEQVSLILECEADAGTAGQTLINVTTAAESPDSDDPVTTGDTLTASVTVANYTNLVTQKKMVPPSEYLSEGDIFAYDIRVKNNGQARATNVWLDDLIPDGLSVTESPSANMGSYSIETGRWNIGTIENGQTAKLLIPCIVNEGTGGETITNNTTAAVCDQQDTTDAEDIIEVSFIVENIADLVTQKSLLSHNSEVAEGDLVTYQIKVINDGPAMATSISLTDKLPSGLTPTTNNGVVSKGDYNPSTGRWEIDTLHNGESATLILEGTVNSGQGAAGVIVNTSSKAIPGDQDDPTDAGNYLTVVLTVTNESDIVVSKTTNHNTPNEGDTIIFTVQVENNGPNRVTNLTVTDDLPTGLTFVSAAPQQGSWSAPVWTVGTLNVGETAILYITVTVDVGTGGNTITNEVTHDQDQTDSNITPSDPEEGIIVGEAADIVTIKTLTRGQEVVFEGDTVGYTITVTNTGLAMATNVTLTDTLPAGLTATSNNGLATLGTTYEPSTGLWTIGTMAVGDVVILNLEGTVDAGQNGNTITNTTTAATGDQPDPTTDKDTLSATVTVGNFADIVLSKHVNNPNPDENEIIYYLITVTNHGPANVTNLVITDTLPEGLTYFRTYTTKGTWNSPTWDIGTLNIGEHAVLEITAMVNSGQAGNTIVNTVTKTHDQEDLNINIDHPEATITVNNEANLVTVKTVNLGAPVIHEGEYVIFDIVVTNNGPARATNVSLYDPVPEELELIVGNGVVSQGTADPVTGIWDIGTIESGASATLTAYCSIKEGTAGDTIINITTAATGDQVDTTTTGDTLEVFFVVDGTTDLVISKINLGETNPAEQTAAEFLVQVNNKGPALATNIQITDFVPAGLTATNIFIASQGSFDYITGIWTIGTLSAEVNPVAGFESRANLYLQCQVDVGTAGDTLTNVIGDIVLDQLDTISAGDDLVETVIIDNNVDLMTRKTLLSGDNYPSEGDTVTYQITVTNTVANKLGTGAMATNISLTDKLPGELIPTANNGTASNGNENYDPVSGVWTIDTLFFEEEETLILEGVVSPGTSGDTILNITTIATADQIDTNRDSDDLEESVVVDNRSEIILNKTVDNATPNEGDTIVYTIEVTNNGPAKATSLIVTDTIPDGVTYVSGTTENGIWNNPVWNIETLDAGSTATLEIIATVDAGTGGSTITNTASHEQDQVPVSDDVNEILDAIIEVNNESDIVIRKTVDDSVPNEGGTIEYTLVVANNGPAQVDNLVVTDNLPVGVTYVDGVTNDGTWNNPTWSIGTLPAGDSAVLNITATVDIGTGGNTITNTASHTQDQTDSNISTDDPTEVITVNNDADILITKTVNTPTPDEGEEIFFTVQVTNNGPIQVTGLVVTDDMPEGITGVQGTTASGTWSEPFWNIDTLGIGETVTLELTAIVNAGTCGDTITNTAHNEQDQIDCNTSIDEPSANVIINCETDIVVLKDVSGSDHNEKDKIVYLIGVLNKGPAQATNVVVTDVLPAGLMYLDIYISMGEWIDPDWNIGTLNSGQAAIMEITAQVEVGTGGDTIYNTVTIGQDQVDVNTSPDDTVAVVFVNNESDIVINKTVDNPTPDEGETIVYTIEVTNNGITQVNNLVVTDSLPEGVTYQSAGTPTMGTWSNPEWNIGTMDAGEKASLNIIATVDAGTGGSEITNTATHTQEQTDTNESKDDSTEVITVNNETDIVINKTVDNPTPDEGDTITYTIEIINNGPAVVTNLVVSDQLHDELTYLDATVSQGTWTPPLWEIGTLEVGDTATFEIPAIVNPGTSGLTIVNTSTHSQDQFDSNFSDDDPVETIVINSEADIVIAKTVSTIVYAAGDTVTYTIKVTNNGPAMVTNLVVTDELPDGLTFISASPADGTTWLAPEWTIGSLENGASVSLVIKATVNVGADHVILNSVSHTQDQVDSNATVDFPAVIIIVLPVSDMTTVKTLISVDTTPSEGDIVRYEIVVINAGPEDATNVQLTDSLPDGLTPTANNGTVWPDTTIYDESTGLWTIGTMSADSYATLMLEGTVDVGTGGDTITNITTAASGDQIDPSNDGDNLEITVVVDNAADLVTEKVLASGDDTPAEGDTVTYQINVVNESLAQATNIELTDLLPAGLIATGNNGTRTHGTYNSVSGLWHIDVLNSEETATLVLEGKVEAGQGGNSITNITTAGETTDQLDTTDTGDNLEVTIDVENESDIVVLKTVDNSMPDEGSTITYMVEVTNNGPAQATNLVVTDNLPEGVTFQSAGTPTMGTWNNPVWDIGTLDAGATASLEIIATVDAGTGGSIITNVMVNTQDQTDSNTGNDVPEVDIIVNNETDLVLTKTVDNPAPNEGDTIVYTVELVNNGPAQATNIKVTDYLPVGITYIDGSADVGNWVSPFWTIDSLNVGVTATLEIAATVDVGTAGDTITNAATQSMDQTDSIAGTDTPEVDIVVNNESDIVIKKIVDNPTPDEGNTIVFKLTIINNGPAQATNVVVSDTLPEGLTYISGSTSTGSWSSPDWNIGTLSAGDSATLEITAMVDAGSGGSTITNTVAHTQDQNDADNSSDDATETVTVNNITDVVITKTVDNPATEEGSTIVYTIEVTNNGAAQAKNLVVTDNLPAGVTYVSGTTTDGTWNNPDWEIGTLNAGATAILDISATVDTGTGGDTINNIAAYTHDQTDTITDTDYPDVDIIINNESDIVIKKTVDNPIPNEGDNVVYHIVVTNNGPAQVDNLVVTDALPEGITFVSESVSDGTWNNPDWEIGTLNAGDSATLDITANVDIGTRGVVTNTATHTQDQTDTNITEDDPDEIIAINSLSNLVTVKTLTSGNTVPAEGDVVAYQIVVTNNGPVQATNVVLTDLLPSGLTPTVNNGNVSQGTYNNVTGLWEVGTIEVDTFATLELEGTVNAGMGGSIITNTTTAAETAEQLDITTTGDSLQVIITVENTPDLITVKTLASADNNPAEGNVVTFLITVTNNGPGETTNVSLTDLLPAGLTATSNNGTVSQGTYNSISGLWNIGTLANGQSATLKLEGTVDVGIGGSTITNTTTAASTPDQIDPTNAGNDLTESVKVEGGADLITRKSLDSGNPMPSEGDIVTFRIEVENNGAARASNVSLIDLLPGGLTPTSRNGNVSEGAYSTTTGVWHIEYLDNSEDAWLILEGTVDEGTKGDTITNITTAAKGDQPDPTGLGDDLEETVIVNADSSLNTTVAVDDSYITLINVTISDDVSTNDFDPQGDNQVRFTVVNEPANGTITLNNDGTFEYIPVNSFEGNDQFIYEVCDDGTPVACDTAIVAIKVVKDTIGGGGGWITGDSILYAINDINLTMVNNWVEGHVLVNDIAPGGLSLSANPVLISTPNNGEAILHPDGSYRYTPDSAFEGEDVFIYEVCNEVGLCDTAVVSLSVIPYSNGENRAPVAVNDNFKGKAGIVITGNLVSNDFDPDGDGIVINTRPLLSPERGALIINPDGTFTYEPEPGFAGRVIFNYELCDDRTPELCDRAIVTIRIFDVDSEVNTTVATDDAMFTQKDILVQGDVSNNDYDPEGDRQAGYQLVAGPFIGSLTFNEDGTFDYLPELEKTGNDYFVYKVCDNEDPKACDLATAYIVIEPVTDTTENNPPVAVNDTFQLVDTNEVAGDVLSNDYDPDGDNILIDTVPVLQPEYGTVSINSDGTFTYYPDESFVDADSFRYEICDTGTPSLCAQATVVIYGKTDQNNPPVAVTDSFFIFNNYPMGGVLLTNDYDPDGDNLIINTTPVSQATQGDVTINEDGTFTFIPTGVFTGTDSFSYEICDDGNPVLCDVGLVVISIADTDIDGIPDDIDVDDDNDGILDNQEGDGTVDTDNDGIPDSYDIDSDNDGIPDNIEGQAEGNYKAPTGVDTDGDGLDDEYDPDTGGVEIIPVDTDSDGIPDYLDDNSDNDGVGDEIEGHDANSDGVADVIKLGYDFDRDGLDDAYDNVELKSNITGSIASLQDFDGDGIRDWRDDNDDDDAKLTVDEDLNGDGDYSNDDSDMDGYPDYLDADDVCELFIPNGFSPNGDNINDYFVIDCIHLYPDAKIEIYNRWGNLVYEKEQYGNTQRWGTDDAWWDGRSTHKWTVGSDKLPTGTYIYILDLNDGSEPEKGSIFINY